MGHSPSPRRCCLYFSVSSRSFNWHWCASVKLGSCGVAPGYDPPRAWWCLSDRPERRLPPRGCRAAASLHRAQIEGKVELLCTAGRHVHIGPVWRWCSTIIHELAANGANASSGEAFQQCWRPEFLPERGSTCGADGAKAGLGIGHPANGGVARGQCVERLVSRGVFGLDGVDEPDGLEGLVPFQDAGLDGSSVATGMLGSSQKVIGLTGSDLGCCRVPSFPKASG